MRPNLFAPNPAVSQVKFLQYVDYQLQFDVNPAFGPSAQALYNDMGIYQTDLGGNLSLNPFIAFSLPGQPGPVGVVDAGYEVVPDRRYAYSSDLVFTPDETAALQLVTGDYTKVLGLSSPASASCRSTST